MQRVMVIAIVLAACLYGFTAEFQKTYTVEPGAAVEVYNVNGDINVSVWDKDVVEVNAVKTSLISDDMLARASIKILAEDVFTITTEYLEHNIGVSVDYTIYVPADAKIQNIETANGDIKLEGVKGNMILNTANGDIKVTHVKGSIDASAANGDIVIKASSTIFDASTASGDIIVEIYYVADEGLDLSTANGSIEIYLGKDLNAGIDASTAIGKVSVHDVDLHVDYKSKTVLEAEFGEGGNLIDASTSVGDIEIYKVGD